MPSARELRDLVDKEAIRDVLSRFCRAVDRLDRELYETIYHPDATFEFFGDETPQSAAATIEAAFELVPQYYDLLSHSLGTINIDLHGDTAYCESYYSQGAVLRDRRDGQRVVRWARGRYVDKLERRDGEWRISRRIMVREFSDTRAATEEGPYAPPAGDLGRDPIYVD